MTNAQWFTPDYHKISGMGLTPDGRLKLALTLFVGGHCRSAATGGSSLKIMQLLCKRV
ncbi:MAG: hypothetical protein R2867_10230 [Caldilineaceae bacterium]